MTLDRGDSPLAGRRPAPLSSVAGLGAINPISSIGSVGTVHSPGSMTSLGTLGPMSTMGSIPGGANAANSASSLNSHGSIASTSPVEARNSSSFWLELKGVERWFDKLEPHERVTLMTSLFARSPEPQLHQYSSTIDKALRNQSGSAPSTNLSRFGVIHNHGGANQKDIGGVYNYRGPLSAGATASGPSSGANLPQTSGSVPKSGVAATHANGSTSSASGANSQGTVAVSSASASTGSLSSTAGKATMGPARVGSAGTGHAASHAQVESGGAASGASGFVSPLAFSSTSSHSSDLYNNAFLPLPRSQGFSPWGPEIRRPNSAAADAWPDTTRHSPTLKSTSNTGSPKLSALSLETPPPFPSGSAATKSATNSSSHSPIGHPLKPWRTFTPHQKPIGSGIGQAPDSNLAPRSTNLSRSSPPSPPSGPVGSAPAHNSSGHNSAVGSSASSAVIGSAPVYGSSAFSLGTQSSSGASSSASSTTGYPPHSAASSTYGSAAMQPGKASNSSPPSIKDDIEGRGNIFGSTTSPSATSAALSGQGELASSSPRPGSVTPKDNRLARRSVNVVDLELLSDIGAWLRSLRLHKYTGNLSGMRWQDVIHLDEKDLEDRGVNALGARRKLLKMFEEIRAAQEAGQLPGE